MQKINPMLADPLLQIGDTAGQFSPLVLQRRDNMWFGHNPYPLEKMRLCSSRWALLASRSGWRLIHKTGKPRTARRFTVYRTCPLATPEDRLFFLLTYLKTYACLCQ